MKKLLLPVIMIAIAITACTKEGATEGGSTNNPDTTVTPTPVAGADSVVLFQNVNVGWSPNSSVYGRVFSSKTGTVYLDNSIPDSMGKYIDLAFNYLGSIQMNFLSANNASFDLSISGARTTLVRNYVPADTFALSAFDTLTHAVTLKKLYVSNDDNNFGATDLPLLVFFKNADGKKGIVKVKSLASDHIIADVKVQY
ncbi:hypothetical protein [Chitinophaga sancti]|uniref:Uncharacterized protein n=1 Tax=Chitinophaga sancti TaxID=1004 RepID=A0A1K1MQ02_9BACT|nr:hypothetical protein [Chitinophaga sancti]WQD62885.1 hypothetical protein U0033_00655 [Chitinophaga sancti]WQG91491.1 hypothetical protein SR876_08260 [Chitinophaga sancti]SFW25258.1 hypothetical protein SAMN05661012_00783 [Chitinophaga sancti]